MNKKQKQSIINLIIAVILGLILSYILGFVASGFQINPDNWLIRSMETSTSKTFLNGVYTFCTMGIMASIFLILNDNNDSE
jgi:biotin transporter BioY